MTRKENNMAWLAVDENEEEYIFDGKPCREESIGEWVPYENSYIKLPSGTINKLIGKELTWNDEPVELV